MSSLLDIMEEQREYLYLKWMVTRAWGKCGKVTGCPHPLILSESDDAVNDANF